MKFAYFIFGLLAYAIPADLVVSNTIKDNAVSLVASIIIGASFGIIWTKICNKFDLK